MRVALAPAGSRGDVHPLLALGEAFRARGHAVRLCAPPDFADEARARGFEWRPVGGPIRAFLEQQARAVASPGLPMIRAILAYLGQEVERQHRELPDAVRGCDVLFGGGVQIAGPTVAECLGVPYRYVAYCAALAPSDHHGPAFVGARAVHGRGARTNRALWRLFDLLVVPWVRRAVDRHRSALGLAPIDDALDHLLGRAPLLAVDAGLAPVPPDLAGRFEPVACLHPMQGPPLPAKLDHFLASGPPPVYLGFGSMTDTDPAATTALVLEAVGAAGCRALLARGWAGLGDAPLPEGVMALDAVSHARLFPRCAAVVHHGGAGTSHTAARAGVPQLLVPHLMDQFYWAHCLEALGIALPGPRRARLTAAGLAEALRELVENEVLRERAADVGARLRETCTREADLALVVARAERAAAGRRARIRV